MNEVMIGIAIAAIILSVIAIISSVVAISFVIGWKNSTHQVEFLDPNAKTGDKTPEQEFADIEKDLDREFTHI